MKSFYLLTISIFSMLCSNGQEFSFQIYFTDAIGNRDTISLGYDSLATDSIDATFGEVDILGQPADTTLDVRIFNSTYFFLWSQPGPFETKRQIVKKNCVASLISAISIRTRHWPVTAQWDSTLFYNSCRYGSLITSINPGGWFDTGSPSDLTIQEFAFNDSITFTSNSIGGVPFYAYVDASGDTVAVYWSTFADSSLLIMNISEISQSKELLSITPNPASTQITMDLPETFGRSSVASIYSYEGRLITKLLLTGSDVDITSLPAGLYFILAENNNGIVMKGKFVKTN